MSLNSKARAVCQFMTAHALRMPRQALILRLHCFSKQPWHRLSKRLCTSTLPCHDGREEDPGDGTQPSLPSVTEESFMPECSTMNLSNVARYSGGVTTTRCNTS